MKGLQKVLKGYRVVLPYEIRKRFDIKIGDWVIVEVDEEEGIILIRPVDVTVKPRKIQSMGQKE